MSLSQGELQEIVSWSKLEEERPSCFPHWMTASAYQYRSLAFPDGLRCPDMGFFSCLQGAYTAHGYRGAMNQASILDQEIYTSICRHGLAHHIRQ